MYRCFLAVDILCMAFAYPLRDVRMPMVLGVYEQFMTDVGEPVNSVMGDAFFDNKAFCTFNETLMVEVYTDVAKDDHITSQSHCSPISFTTTLMSHAKLHPSRMFISCQLLPFPCS